QGQDGTGGPAENAAVPHGQDRPGGTAALGSAHAADAAGMFADALGTARAEPPAWPGLAIGGGGGVLVALAAGVAFAAAVIATAAVARAVVPGRLAMRLPACRLAVRVGRMALGRGQAGSHLEEIFRQRPRRELDAGQALDIADVGLFVRRDIAQRNAI